MNLAESLTCVPCSLRYIFKQRLQPASLLEISEGGRLAVATHTSRVSQDYGVNSPPPPSVNGKPVAGAGDDLSSS